MSGVKIQHASDLHLEFEPNRTDFTDILLSQQSKNFNTEPGTNERDEVYLVLGGDIGTLTQLPVLKRFLEYCVKNWTKVFYIPGNHEYYHSDYDDANRRLKVLCDEIGVIFALFESYVIHRPSSSPSTLFSPSPCRDIVLIMTTLWSDIPESNASIVKRSLNDYRLITTRDNDEKGRITRPFTPELSTAIHLEQRSKLKALVTSICEERSADIVVFTHHSPHMTGTSDPIFEGKETNCAFSSDCSDIMKEGVPYWVYGHTHYNPKLLNVHGTMIVSNQRGYSGDLCDGYSPTKILILP